MTGPDPIPRAMPGALNTPPAALDLETDAFGDPVQDPIEASQAPSNFKSFATPDNGIGTNATYDFYTVPAGKNFVCNSCKCAENTSTATNIQFVALKQIGGANPTKFANAYLYGGDQRELVQAPFTFEPGSTVRLATGGAVTFTIAQVTGYLVDLSQSGSSAPAPARAQIRKNPRKV